MFWTPVVALASRFVLLCILIFAFAVGALELSARLRAPVNLDKVHDTSFLVLDSNGQWADAALSSDDKWRFSADLSSVPKAYLAMLLSFEDRRFYKHYGVSFQAILRAAAQRVRYGRVVSGASTITMQVARLLEGPSSDITGKLSQIIAARRLNIDFTKDEILQFYLVLAPFGGNIEGIEAASLYYFAKRASELSLEEISLLVAIPQSPEMRRLDRGLQHAISARQRVLQSAVGVAEITAELADELDDSRPAIRRWLPFNESRQTVLALREVAQTQKAVQTYLDLSLQQTVKQSLEEMLDTLTSAVNGAALVVRNSDGAIIARVANARGVGGVAGYMDLSAQVRSPGSALKPFLYGQAFDLNLTHPYTLFHDVASRYGVYSPRNYGNARPGAITLRDALSSSLNTAAIALAQKVGPQKFIAQLKASGANVKLPPNDVSPGLGVVLGGLGISLTDLAGLYVALANHGQPKTLRLSELQESLPAATRLFGEEAALAVTRALVGAKPPDGEVKLRAVNGASRIAYKTGTSSGRRDVWAIGYDKTHTVAVWIGRPDNGSFVASGRETAAPVLWSIFRALPKPPQGVAQVMLDKKTHLSSSTPPARFKTLNQNAAVAELQIQFPTRSGTVVRRNGQGKMTLRISGGVAPFTWIVNDEFIATGSASSLDIEVSSGAFTMTVVDDSGKTDSLETWINN